MIRPEVWDHVAAKAPERPREKPARDGDQEGPRGGLPRPRGLLGALAAGITRGLAAAIAGAAPSPTAPAVCSMCARGRREGLHVSAVFRLRGGTPEGPEGQALVVFLDGDDGRARLLCLEHARAYLTEATRTVFELEVEK